MHFSNSAAPATLVITKALQAKHGGTLSSIFESLPAYMQPPAVRKAVMDAISGPALLPSNVVTDFIETQRQNSFVAAALSDFVKLPFYASAAVFSTLLDASEIDTAEQIPVSGGSLFGKQLAPRKTASLQAFSNELLETLDVKSINQLNRAIARAHTRALDKILFSEIVAHAGTEMIPATSAILDDLKSALDYVSSDEGSGRFFWVGKPSIANKLSTMEATGGNRLFPELSPNGGELLNLPFVVTASALETDSSGGKLLLIDAGRIAANFASLQIDSGREAAIQLVNNPSGAPADLVSMWQIGATAIRSTLEFGFEILAPDADPMAAIITGI